MRDRNRGLVLGGFRALLAGSSAVAAVAAFAPLAEAQTQTNTQQATSEDTVIVTARRREEEIQDVPLSITALGAEALRDRNVAQPTDLQQALPGLIFTQSSDSAQNAQFNIRGSGQSFGGSLPGVITYFADVPLDFHGGGAITMYDVSNVQVARGPQGTLFGRNTTGGAVLMVPHAPGDTLGGYFDIRGGNFALFQARGAIDIPITESLQLRLSGDLLRRNGTTTDLRNNVDMNDQNSTSYRGYLRWTPTENLTNDLIYQYVQGEEHGTAYILKDIRPDGATAATRSAMDKAMIDSFGVNGSANYLAAQRARGPFEYFSTGGSGQRREIDIIVNTTSYQLTPDITLRNIFGRENIATWYGTDIDGSELLVNYSHAMEDHRHHSFTDLVRIGPETKLQQTTNELQLLGTSFDGRLDWIVGGFYFHVETPQTGFVDGRDSTSNLTWRGDNVPPPSIYSYSQNSIAIQDDSHAFFAQGTLDLFAGLSATAGYRYTWDTRRTTSGQLTERTTGGANGSDELPPFTCSTAGIPNNGTIVTNQAQADACLRTLEAESSADGYHFGLDWRLSDDVLIYGVTRHNYKAGGQNFINTLDTNQLIYSPEYATDYEFGIKTDWDFGFLSGRTNIALYHIDYEDLQRNVTVNTGIAVATLVYNAASAQIDGAEWEAMFHVGDNWDLSTFFSYTDARYDSFTNPSDGADLSADKFVGTPSNQGGATLEYHMPMASGGQFAASLSYYAQGRMAYRANQVQNAGLFAPGYELFDGRLTWRDVGGGPLDISLWGKNLTDQEYIVAGIGLYGSTLGYNSVIYGDPRTFGFEAVYRFGN